MQALRKIMFGALAASALVLPGCPNPLSTGMGWISPPAWLQGKWAPTATNAVGTFEIKSDDLVLAASGGSTSMKEALSKKESFAAIGKQEASDTAYTLTLKNKEGTSEIGWTFTKKDATTITLAGIVGGATGAASDYKKQ